MTLDTGVSGLIDTAAPLAPVISGPADLSYVTDLTPEVSGTGEAGSTVNVVAGASSCSAVVDGAGNWTCVLGPALSDGAGVAIVATQTDTAGNTSPSDTSTVMVDATVPTITSNSAGAGSAAFGATVGALSVASTVIVFSELINAPTLGTSDFNSTALNGATISGISCVTVSDHSECTVSLNLASATAGTVAIQLNTPVVTDLADNPMSTTTLPTAATWTMDTTAPTVTINLGSAPVGATTLDPVNNSNKAAYTITGTCEAGAGNVTVTVAAQSPTSSPITCSGAGTWSATFNLTSVADNTSLGASASQTDVAGNVGSDSETVAKDVVVPTVVSDTAGAGGAAFGSSINASSTVNVQVTFAEPIQTGTFNTSDFSVSTSGVTGSASVSAVSCSSSTICTLTFDVSALSGTGTVSVNLAVSPTILDLAGNNLSTTTLPTTATWNFSDSIEISGSQYESCNDLAIDSLGNRICVGEVQSSIGEANGGAGDLFIMKTDSSGDVLWFKQMGAGSFGANAFANTSGIDQCRSVTIDSNDDIYCGGFTTSSLGENLAGGVSNAFLIKVSKDGEFRWIKQIGNGAFGDSFTGASSRYVDESQISGIAFNSQTNQIVFVGYVNASLVEDKSGEKNLLLGSVSVDGNLEWARQAGQGAFGSALGISGLGVYETVGHKVAVNQSNGDVYLMHAGTNYNGGICELQINVAKVTIASLNPLDHSLGVSYSGIDGSYLNYGGCTPGNSAISSATGDILVVNDRVYVTNSLRRDVFVGLSAGGLTAIKTHHIFAAYDSNLSSVYSVPLDRKIYSNLNDDSFVTALTYVPDPLNPYFVVAGSSNESPFEAHVETAQSAIFWIKILESNGDILSGMQLGELGAAGTSGDYGNINQSEHCKGLAYDSVSGSIVCGGITDNSLIDGSAPLRTYYRGSNGDIMIMPVSLAAPYWSSFNDFGEDENISGISVSCVSTDTVEATLTINGYCESSFSHQQIYEGESGDMVLDLCEGGQFSFSSSLGTQPHSQYEFAGQSSFHQVDNLSGRIRKYFTRIYTSSGSIDCSGFGG